MAVRLKTDENLPDSAAILLRTAGHDVTTILEEKLGGAADPKWPKCAEARHGPLVKLDRGLGNIRAYPPTDYQGIVVLRPREQGVDAILALVKTLVTLLETNTLAGTLWIVDERPGSAGET